MELIQGYVRVLSTLSLNPLRFHIRDISLIATWYDDSIQEEAITRWICIDEHCFTTIIALYQARVCRFLNLHVLVYSMHFYLHKEEFLLHVIPKDNQRQTKHQIHGPRK